MVDFFGILERNGLEVRRHSSDRNEFKICCPYCPEKGRGLDFGFRLGFNIESGLGHCFRCGWSSRKALIEILRKVDSKDFELAEISTQYFSGETRERPKPVKWPGDWTLLKDVEDYDPLWGPPKRYIEKRGVTRKQLRIHEVGATREDNFYLGRVVFPCRDEKGKLCGFVGRDWTGESPLKYLNSRGNKIAYNVRHDYPQRDERIIVCEGVLKALAVERATEYKVCCASTLGNSITDTQVNQFKVFGEIVLFPDPDVMGMLGYLGVADNLQPVVRKLTMVWPWPEKQADELEPGEILELLENRRWVSPVVRLRLRSEMRRR